MFSICFHQLCNLLNKAVTGRWGIEVKVVPQPMLKRPKPYMQPSVSSLKLSCYLGTITKHAGKSS